jgi:hypothetical protein
MTIFETEEDLKRERKAIEVFVNMFGGSFKKLDPMDVDYRVFDKDGNMIAYAEVKGRIKPISKAYPLPVAARKLVKLVDKRLNAVIIWACDDGIIYGKVEKLVGTFKWGGKKNRDRAYNDLELMVYYEKQKELRYLKFN